MDFLIELIRRHEAKHNVWGGYDAIGRALQDMVFNNPGMEDVMSPDTAIAIFRGKRANLRPEQRRLVLKFLYKNGFQILIDNAGNASVVKTNSGIFAPLIGDYHFYHLYGELPRQSFWRQTQITFMLVDNQLFARYPSENSARVFFDGDDQLLITNSRKEWSSITGSYYLRHVHEPAENSASEDVNFYYGLRFGIDMSAARTIGIRADLVQDERFHFEDLYPQGWGILKDILSEDGPRQTPGTFRFDGGEKYRSVDTLVKRVRQFLCLQNANVSKSSSTPTPKNSPVHHAQLPSPADQDAGDDGQHS